MKVRIPGGAMAYAIPDGTPRARAVRRPPEAPDGRVRRRGRVQRQSRRAAHAARAARTWSASALDRSSMPDVLGTVAGDDTVLVVCTESVGGSEVVAPSSPPSPASESGSERIIVTQASRARVFGWARHVGRGAVDPRGVGRRGRSRARSTSASSKPGEDDDDPRARARPPARSRSRSSTPAPSSRRDFLVPALQANALYEGKYPLVSALSRPVIVEHLVASARRHRADAVGHGCTGKGNDQVRFEVSSRILAPDLDVLAPVRVWGLTRADCIDLAAQVGDPDRGDEGEALLDRREHVGPRDRVRRAREPVVVGARGAVHAHAQPERRAARAARDRRRLRAGRAGVARRHSRSDLVELIDELGAAGRRVRLGPHRHGREPPGRHQEPRGVRVPGVARAGARAQGPRRHHARTRRRAREAARRDPRRRADLRRPVARAAACARSQAFVDDDAGAT